MIDPLIEDDVCDNEVEVRLMRVGVINDVRVGVGERKGYWHGWEFGM